ncbi:thioesterase domain-containing protein, partial [Salarchaeum sp. III]|uniref:thioesterase domain-containing protein n=1 Tax=Salarchaeum sp. III TaxID=3107927 RepID=UPI002EDA053D
VGRPINNTELYILDEKMQPVPIGVTGELYIGGDGVADGYWNRPELTSEQFVRNPFTGRGLIYRTGDRARYFSDRTVECLGRIDNQIKVRGYRIEPSEIESVLEQHPYVREAVVLAKYEDDNGTSLHAYLVTKSNEVTIDLEELRNICLSYLPKHMIPNAFKQLEEIPLTPNGKADHNKLKEMNTLAINGSYTPPRNLDELNMCKVWESLLDLSPIGVHDNFFAIGGHSLKALQLQNIIQEKLDVELSLNAIFKKPTVAELCTQLNIENLGQESEQDSLMVQLAEGNGENSPLVLIHPHGGGILSYIHLVNELDSNETVYGIQAIGYDSDKKPLSSIEEMVSLYVDVIRRAIPKGPYRLMGWSFGGTVAYEIARKFEELGEEIEFIGLLDSHPLDIPGEVNEEFTEQDAIKYLAILFDLEINMDSNLSLEENISRLLDEAKKSGKLTKGMTVDSIKQKISVLISHSKALMNYQYEGPIASDLKLFCVNNVSKHLHSLVDPKEWLIRTTGEVDVVEVQGDHHTMVEPPYVNVLATQIQKYLSGATVTNG